tara:strand:- start:9 stop:512 length:504 start_codon:yes stop_codon:yes gene_type:complete
MTDIFSDYVDDDISNFFLKKLKYFASRPRIFYDHTSTMKGDYFGSVNLLPFLDKKAFTYLERIKKKVEEFVSTSLMYHYLHMLDYTKGGYIELHNHIKAEDYSSLLYLNDCDDGATYFISDGKEYEFLPEKNKLLMYPSHILHGGRYTTSKKVLVSGYKFKYKFLTL